MSIKVWASLIWPELCLVLMGCTRDPVDDLVAKLQDTNVDVRRAATRIVDVQTTGDERVIAALTKCVADADIEVRYNSIDALGKFGSTSRAGLPALKQALADAAKPVRIRAAFSIAKIAPQDRSFIPVLVGAMREGDGRTLLEIGEMGPEATWAVPTLIGLLSHESPKVRTLAANDLGHIGPAAKSAKVALRAALKDPNAAVKRAAQSALERIGASTAGIAK